MKKKILTLDTDKRLDNAFDLSEKQTEESIRPKYLSDYVGQEKLKTKLSVYIEAAKKRTEPLDHCLFYGPPGLGKTTLAYIIANELKSDIKTCNGASFEKPADIVSILSSLEENDVLFIDEVHRISTTLEELLYSAMEDFYIDILIGTDNTAHSVRLDLPHFTLVAATTLPGQISSPLRDRFGIIDKLEYYNDKELTDIVLRTASVLQIPIDKSGAEEIGRRSRGTPRIANRLVRRIRDFAEVKHEGLITKKVATESLDILDIDKLGLDENDRRYLSVLVNEFSNSPVGIATLAVSLGEDERTIEEVYEPYLIVKNLIKRTRQGRVATDLAYEHIGVDTNKLKF